MFHEIWNANVNMFHEIWNVTLKSNANVNVKKCDASFASKVLERLLGRLLRFFSSRSVGLCRPFIISLFEPWQHFHWFLNLADNEVRIRCSLSSVETPNCRSAVELCFWQKDFWWEFQSEKGQHDMSKFVFLSIFSITGLSNTTFRFCKTIRWTMKMRLIQAIWKVKCHNVVSMRIFECSNATMPCHVVQKRCWS